MGTSLLSKRNPLHLLSFGLGGRGSLKMQGFQPRGSFFECSYFPIVMVKLIFKKSSASVSIKKYVIRLFTVRRHPLRDTFNYHINYHIRMEFRFPHVSVVRAISFTFDCVKGLPFFRVETFSNFVKKYFKRCQELNGVLFHPKVH